MKTIKLHTYLKRFKNATYWCSNAAYRIGLLLSSRIKNDTDQIFIARNRLNNAKDSLIKRKIYKVLAGINLNVITNWVKAKGVYNWVGVRFDELKKHKK